MGEDRIGLIFFSVFMVFWLINAWAMLFRPKTWIDWFVARPWKDSGIRIVIDDENKLRRKLRLPAISFAIVGIALLAAASWHLLSGPSGSQ
jgi:hypothetical protein